MPSGPELGMILAAYAVGCFTSAYYLVRWRTGRDVRAAYSGNAGARNAGRVLGRRGFLATFALDFAKGALVVAAARWLVPHGHVVAAAMIAVVVGHVWPVQLGFRGGKGVSASLGALAVFDLVLLASLVAAFAVLYPMLRRFTLCGILAFALAPLGGLVFDLETGKVAAAFILAAIVVFAHREDLRDELVLRFGPGSAEATGRGDPTEGGMSGNEDHGD